MKSNRIISVILSLVYVITAFSVNVVQGEETEQMLNSSIRLNEVIYEKNSER